MSLAFHEYRQGMVVMAGQQTLVTGRKVPGGWLLAGKGICWLDPAARRPNVAGIIDARFLLLKTKEQARREMKSPCGALICIPRAGSGPPAPGHIRRFDFY